jgi:antitoxin component of RelBE/YafQ-DinJ toxin-antitoxin module
LTVRIAQEGRLPFDLQAPSSEVVQALKEARHPPMNKDQIFLC